MKLKAPRVGSIRKLSCAPIDRFDTHIAPWDGYMVRVIQPFGTPKNGTMNHCYVETADTSEFIGLVHINSLVKD
jgi:hypothetical protein